MVRVGGGWVALDEFLLKNDPCRGKYSLLSSFNLKLNNIRNSGYGKLYILKKKRKENLTLARNRKVR